MMKTNGCLLLLVLCLYSLGGVAADPNDGGIGGTGKGKGAVEVDVFERPDLETIDVPLPTDAFSGVPNVTETAIDNVPDNVFEGIEARENEVGSPVD